MQIVSFSVENYRSITQARQIQLSSSTVLIGPNNEGKSNILRALSAGMFALSKYAGKIRGAYRERVSSRLDGDIARFYDWERDFPVSRKEKGSKKTTKITFEFLLSDDEIIEFKNVVKSNLNGTLPICVEFNKINYDIHIVKQGPGSTKLNQNSDVIARFLAEKIQFQYIPAVRTAKDATRIVENIIASELSDLENKEEYIQAMRSIRDLQRPVLEKFSVKTTETLKIFLPSINSVIFSVSDEQRNFALRRSIDIEIDDGVVTSLEAKGDGVQSLVALGLRRHLLEENRGGQTYILAIEEPESHLHPDAIHELQSVLRDIAKVDQIIITTHSGLLANRSPINSNVIVRKSKASPAKNISEIRSALGIRSADNLINAEVILLVEGDDDKLSISSIIEANCKNLYSDLTSGRLAIESLGGVSALSSKISLYKGILCRVHCFIDDDDEARGALKRALDSNIIDTCDYNLARFPGKNESEFEDFIRQELYEHAVMEKFGVDLTLVKPKNRKSKWSSRIENVFHQCGKDFDKITKQRIKFLVAESVVFSPKDAILESGNEIFKSLFSSLEGKIHQ